MHKNKQVLKTAIKMAWLSLIICFSIKLFFPDLFLMFTHNNRLVEFCNIIEHNIYLKSLFTLLFSTLLFTPYWLSIYKLIWFKNKPDFYIFATILMLNCLSKILFSSEVSFILELMMFLVYPTVDLYVKNRKEPIINSKIKMYFRPTISYLLVMIFECVSLFIKNQSIVFYSRSNIVFYLIFFVDLFIMVLLYYFYNIKE